MITKFSLALFLLDEYLLLLWLRQDLLLWAFIELGHLRHWPSLLPGELSLVPAVALAPDDSGPLVHPTH